jgi:hypothetical protein
MQNYNKLELKKIKKQELLQLLSNHNFDSIHGILKTDFNIN